MERRNFLKVVAGTLGALALPLGLGHEARVRAHSHGLFVNQLVELVPGETIRHSVFENCRFVRANTGDSRSIVIRDSIFRECEAISMVCLRFGVRVGVVDLLHGCDIRTNDCRPLVAFPGNQEVGSLVSHCRPLVAFPGNQEVGSLVSHCVLSNGYRPFGRRVV